MEKLLPTGIISALREQFLAKRPYGYANVGELFDNTTLISVSKEVGDHVESLPAERDFYASYRKHKLSDMQRMPFNTQSLVGYLNSQEFIRILEKITNINEIYGDPDLLGGGIHAIGRDGYLKLHTDFNWHPKLKMHRRLNLLIYINEVWDPQWNGNIELWDSNAKTRLLSMAPQLGNALLFETTDFSYHGHPDPLKCPNNVYRKSIAMYYYTQTRPPSQISFGRSEITNYVERPGETFESDGGRRLRNKVELSLKRVLYKLSLRG